MSKKENILSTTASGDMDMTVSHAAPARTLDAGKVRTGAGCRIRTLTARTADTGKIRTGAGCRIRLLHVA